ncbi:hypothetical protein [Bradyrhizobium sp. JR3.5]
MQANLFGYCVALMFAMGGTLSDLQRLLRKNGERDPRVQRAIERVPVAHQPFFRQDFGSSSYSSTREEVVIVPAFSSAATCTDVACGNGNPEAVVSAWGTTNGGVPHIQPGQYAADGKSLCPAFFTSYCVDITGTALYNGPRPLVSLPQGFMALRIAMVARMVRLGAAERRLHMCLPLEVICAISIIMNVVFGVLLTQHAGCN